MSLTVVAAILCLSAAIQLCFFLFLFEPALRFIARKPAVRAMQKEKLPVSVLICAYTEAENLKAHLPLILAQEYPHFEVIVVNDRSEDTTADLLAGFAKDDPKLRIVTISAREARDFPGKKFAISKGIAAAKHELLLLTDADCRPAGSQWISEMTAPLHKGKDIAAGFGDFEKEKGWLNQFIRGETLHTFLQLLAYQHAGMPYMAVGRNLACRKALFEKAQRHPLWKATPSGDDDMLVRLCANKTNMAVVTSPESITLSPAKNSFRDYVRQKQRHLSTGKLYRKKNMFLLALYAGSHAAFWLSAFVLVLFVNKIDFSSPWIVAAIFSFVLRNGMFWAALSRLQKQLRSKENQRSLSPYFDLMWLGYNFAFSPYILWKTKQDWH